MEHIKFTYIHFFDMVNPIISSGSYFFSKSPFYWGFSESNFDVEISTNGSSYSENNVAISTSDSSSDCYFYSKCNILVWSPPVSIIHLISCKSGSTVTISSSFSNFRSKLSSKRRVQDITYNPRTNMQILSICY